MSELKAETSEYEVVEISKLKAEIEQLKMDLATTNSTVAKLLSSLEQKVDKSDVINQINISMESILIDGKKIHITSENMINDKVPAERITSGTINADKVSGITLRDIANTK